MLVGLSIRDVVLIERLDLAFRPGLNVLTGETGAGKSILLDAFGLALGMRAESGMVRSGAQQASAIATFELADAHPALAYLAQQGLEAEAPLILRRSVAADGRSRAFVNDQPVTIAALRAIGNLLVEIHGQHDTHGLLDAGTHRQALDQFAGLETQAEATAAAWHALAAARATEAEAIAAADAARREEDYLRHALKELAELDPQPNEEADLAERRALLSRRGKVIEAVRGAAAELASGRGAAGMLRAAQRQLERVAAQAGGALDAAIAALDRAAIETTDALAAVEAAGAALDADPTTLEKVEERLFALRTLARKHRVDVGALAALRADLAQRIAVIDGADGLLAARGTARAAAAAAYRDAAGALAKARRGAAERLDKALARELPALKLEKAQIRTRVEDLTEADWGPAGTERVSFEVATNPGAPPGPLARIASGGELARFMLALRVVLARTGDAVTLVFDEVDSGVGGATAAAVGQRLARLARDRQVLVVTHSPQVAARAGHHWKVEKRRAGRGVATVVEAIADADRREEIARMLSGAQVTDAARAAADSLIEAART